jgi:hypothetical protein
LPVLFKLSNNKERSCAEEKGRSDAKGNEKTLLRGSSKESENKKLVVTASGRRGRRYHVYLFTWCLVRT